jgi:micrococcal nuclease
MARSRAACVALAAALLGSTAWGWWAGGAPAGSVTATVVAAVDGDTVDVRLASGRVERVRLLGVDTPETKHPERGVECFGPEAAAFTHDRLLGRRVTLEFDAQRRDPYDRLLAYVSFDGRRFNDELLRGGYARFSVIPPNGEHARALLRAELDARAAGRGLWGAC